jgi:CRP-like cAMP-binding protein
MPPGCQNADGCGKDRFVSGRVRIFKTSPNGREQVLAIEGPGASVAELPVFDGGTYPASGSALERTEALFVSRADLRAFYPFFGWTTW